MGFIDVLKPLLKVNDIPLIDVCINYLKRDGFTDLILLVRRGRD